MNGQTIGLEEIFHRYQVDVCLSGHEHSYGTGGLELLAGELLATRWNYWPSIGTIGHKNLAHFFIGIIGQKKNCRGTSKVEGF